MAKTYQTVEEILELMSKPASEILAYGKSRIGLESKSVKGRYPVEYDPIRRYCHSINDDNPLFLDPAYAKKAGFKDAVCPPLLVIYFSGPGIWPPGGEETPRMMPLPMLPPPHATKSPRTSINMATEYEFFKPVVVGDRLSSKDRVADIYMKAIKRDPECLWQTSEKIISNQDGEVVAVAKTIGIDFKR